MRGSYCGNPPTRLVARVSVTGTSRTRCAAVRCSSVPAQRSGRLLRGYLANADKVRTQGIEADGAIRPSERFNAHVNCAYSDPNTGPSWMRHARPNCPAVRTDPRRLLGGAPP